MRVRGRVRVRVRLPAARGSSSPCSREARPGWACGTPGCTAYQGSCPPAEGEGEGEGWGEGEGEGEGKDEGKGWGEGWGEGEGLG